MMPLTKANPATINLSPSGGIAVRRYPPNGAHATPATARGITCFQTTSRHVDITINTSPTTAKGQKTGTINAGSQKISKNGVAANAYPNPVVPLTIADKKRITAAAIMVDILTSKVIRRL